MRKENEMKAIRAAPVHPLQDAAATPADQKRRTRFPLFAGKVAVIPPVPPLSADAARNATPRQMHLNGGSIKAACGQLANRYNTHKKAKENFKNA